MNFKLISIAVLVSTLSAQAGVVHIDNPRFPTLTLRSLRCKRHSVRRHGGLV
jgi:hypothetical protein